LSLPWATTNAVTKKLLELGEAEPDGVEVFQIDKFVLTKG
jgi:hypothetical protein